MAKATADYWADRFTALDDASFRKSEKYAKSLLSEFDRASRQMQKDMSYWYARLAENYKMEADQIKGMIPAASLVDDLKVKKAMELVKANAVAPVKAD